MRVWCIRKIFCGVPDADQQRLTKLKSLGNDKCLYMIPRAEWTDDSVAYKMASTRKLLANDVSVILRLRLIPTSFLHVFDVDLEGLIEGHNEYVWISNTGSLTWDILLPAQYAAVASEITTLRRCRNYNSIPLCYIDLSRGTERYVYFCH